MRRQWLQARIKELGKTQAGLAAALHVDKSAVTKIIDGGRGVKVDEVTVIARFVELPYAEVARLLTDGASQPFSAPSPHPAAPIPGGFQPVPVSQVSVHGEVEAGVWREAVEWPEAERFTVSFLAGPYDHLPRFGLRVRGPSMDLIYPEGSVVVCVPYINLGRQPRSGERVVVERSRGGLVEATVKELEITAEGQCLLWPRSTHPRYQQPIAIDSANLPWGLADGPATFFHDSLAESGSETRITAKVIGSVRLEP